MGRKKKDVLRHKTTWDIPIDVWKELHLVIVHKHGRIYGHLGDSFIEALKLWIKKEKKNMKSEGL